MHRCVVHFENGSKEEIDLRHNFSKNSSQELLIFQETDGLLIALSLCMIQKTTK